MRPIEVPKAREAEPVDTGPPLNIPYLPPLDSGEGEVEVKYIGRTYVKTRDGYWSEEAMMKDIKSTRRKIDRNLKAYVKQYQGHKGRSSRMPRSLTASPSAARGCIQHFRASRTPDSNEGNLQDAA